MTGPAQPQPPGAGVAADYDRVAGEYARRIYGELAGKPFDRALLDRFAGLVPGGRVCDAGCGPGHVARYLSQRGCNVFGVDLSPRMIELAKALNPGIGFCVGDLRALGVADGSLAGIVSFYSLIHLPADQLTPALAGMRRVLRPGGVLLAAVHEGTETRRPADMWGIPVTLEFSFFTYEQLTASLLAAGFAIDQITHRAPYPAVEVATSRLYATAIAAPPAEDPGQSQERRAASMARPAPARPAGNGAWTVRDARPGQDAAACLAIYAPFVLDTSVSFEERAPDPGEFADRIRATQVTHPWLVLEEGSRVIGYAHGSPHRRRDAYRWATDVAIYVAASHRGRGAGRHLYGCLLDRLRRQRFQVACAGIALPNQASIALHRSLGFQPVGTYRRIGFKRGAWLDVSWWQLDLTPAVSEPPPEPLPPGG